MSFAIFDESFYLENNPDVAVAVDAGVFATGLDHFQQYGLAEGRVSVSPFYDEQLYFRANPDVEAAVAGGGFSSGLQHYINNGEAESRSPGAFNELAYRELYPDVAAAIAEGSYSSGLQHYIQLGQSEANRIGFFFGTTGNDTITGIGNNITNITGIDVEATAATGEGRIDLQSSTLGSGEVDTLIGGAARDLFILGTTDPFGSSQSFYVGNTEEDYALIQEFERGSDALLLAGASPVSYNIQVIDSNLNISTLNGDLIAIVEGVTSPLTQIPGTGLDGTFQLG